VEEIRRRVAAMHDGRDTTLPRVTISAGIATLPDCAATIGEAIRAADEALYAAKRGGRDRVEVAPSLRPVVAEPAAPAAEPPAPPVLRLLEPARPERGAG
jgi:hypothetical protein